MTHENKPVAATEHQSVATAEIATPEEAAAANPDVPHDLVIEAFDVVGWAGWHGPEDCPANQVAPRRPSYMALHAYEIWGWVGAGVVGTLAIECLIVLGYGIWAVSQ